MSQIDVRILQQDYVLTCPPGQEDALMAAVARVDEDMERIRNTGKVRARERVGVLVAVNLAFENMNLLGRTRELEEELELTLESNLSALSQETNSNPTAPSEEVEALMAELQNLLALREQELLQAQALISRLETALETDSQLL